MNRRKFLEIQNLARSSGRSPLVKFVPPKTKDVTFGLYGRQIPRGFKEFWK
jgi:hypothetical protein